MGAADFMNVPEDDRIVIDRARPRTALVPARVQQQDDPGENLQTGMVEASVFHLPDPAVGGQFGSKLRNAMTFGVFSRAQRFRPFTGQIAQLPAIEANPVQGYVGRNQTHSAKLRAGVKEQNTNFTTGLRSFAESIVGKLTPTGTSDTAGNG